MRLKYIEFNGKHPKGYKHPEAGQPSRTYYDEPLSQWRSYGAKYPPGFLKCDVDDYDHKTGELVEPIQGKPRSEVITAMLDYTGTKYLKIPTDHGGHFYLGSPDDLERKSKYLNWICAVGIKMEWKFPESDDHMKLKVNGRMLERFGCQNLEDVDPLPKWLYPIQKSRDKPFYMHFPEGDRTQALGGYVRHLVQHKALSVLGKSKLSLLAFADEPVRERLLSDGRLEEMSVRELKSNISAMENESHDVRYRSFRKVFRPEGMGDDALMPVDELKPLPSHEEYYKPRKGKAWLSFLGSVQKHGIIVPVTITDDHYILDGHDRVRACKDLGIEDITVFYATAADEAITHWVEEGLSVDTVKKVYYLTSNAGTPHYPDGSRDFTPEYFARMECCQLFGDEARAKHNADLFVKEAIKWGHIRQDTFLGEAEG